MAAVTGREAQDRYQIVFAAIDGIPDRLCEEQILNVRLCSEDTIERVAVLCGQSSGHEGMPLGNRKR